MTTGRDVGSSARDARHELRDEIGPVPGAHRPPPPPHPDHERVDVVVVGAGPCGLAAAIALGRVGLRAVVLERGCLVSGIYGYPTFMTFFSTAERLSIGGVPFSVATDKPTRRDALAYYRTVARHFALDVRQYETVEQVEHIGGPGAGGADPGPDPAPLAPRFRVRSTTRGSRARAAAIRSTRARSVASYVDVKPTGSRSWASRRRTTSARSPGSRDARTSTARPKRSSSCGRNSPSSGFIVPTSRNRAACRTETPSRST